MIDICIYVTRCVCYINCFQFIKNLIYFLSYVYLCKITVFQSWGWYLYPSALKLINFQDLPTTSRATSSIGFISLDPLLMFNCHYAQNLWSRWWWLHHESHCFTYLAAFWHRELLYKLSRYCISCRFSNYQVLSLR